MKAEPEAPTVSRLLIAPEASADVAAAAHALEIVSVVGPFESLGPAFAEAVARCRGDFVLPVTPDFEPGPGFWEGLALAAAANPDADVVRWRLAGLAPDPA
ncbi:MAG: hypothetical protein ACREEW_11045, partial [Caulobacteraceae bacterium]